MLNPLSGLEKVLGKYSQVLQVMKVQKCFPKHCFFNLLISSISIPGNCRRVNYISQNPPLLHVISSSSDMEGRRQKAAGAEKVVVVRDAAAVPARWCSPLAFWMEGGSSQALKLHQILLHLLLRVLPLLVHDKETLASHAENTIKTENLKALRNPECGFYFVLVSSLSHFPHSTTIFFSQPPACGHQVSALDSEIKHHIDCFCCFSNYVRYL